MAAPISPDNERFLEQAVTDGRFTDRSEAIDEALRLLRRREDLFRSVNAGVDQLDGGQYTEYDEAELDQFLADIRSKAAPSSQSR